MSDVDITHYGQIRMIYYVYQYLCIYADTKHGSYRNTENAASRRKYDCAMWSQIAGVIVNIVFDPLMIFGIGPLTDVLLCKALRTGILLQSALQLRSYPLYF